MNPLSSALSPIIEKYLKETSAFPDLQNVSIQDLRNSFNERSKILNLHSPNYYLTIQNKIIPTLQGQIPIRVYQPPSEGLFPTLIFFHGGGFVFGNLDTLESYCREIARIANCMVISVDYPLSPEHPFPAAPETAYAATIWIYKHLAELKGDPNLLFLGGSSAGATLAAVTSLMIRDRQGPQIAGQILLCPMADTNFDTNSYHKNAKGYNLTREQCIWFWSQYTHDLSQKNPYLAPLHASTFKNLPRTLIVTAEFDPLKDEGQMLAKKLLEAQVSCQNIHYQGMIHGFPTLPLELPEKKDVLQHIKNFIYKTF